MKYKRNYRCLKYCHLWLVITPVVCNKYCAACWIILAHKTTTVVSYIYNASFLYCKRFSSRTISNKNTVLNFSELPSHIRQNCWHGRILMVANRHWHLWTVLLNIKFLRITVQPIRQNSWLAVYWLFYMDIDICGPFCWILSFSELSSNIRPNCWHCHILMVLNRHWHLWTVLLNIKFLRTIVQHPTKLLTLPYTDCFKWIETFVDRLVVLQTI